MSWGTRDDLGRTTREGRPVFEGNIRRKVTLRRSHSSPSTGKRREGFQPQTKRDTVSGSISDVLVPEDPTRLVTPDNDSLLGREEDVVVVPEVSSWYWKYLQRSKPIIETPIGLRLTDFSEGP